MAYNIISAAHIVKAQSMATDVTSPAFNIQNQDNAGIQIDFTGAPVGTFAFEVSMDYKEDNNGNILNAGHWITLPVSPAIAAAGAADQAYVDLNQLSAPYMRVVYNRTSGTGVLDIYASAKGV